MVATEEIIDKIRKVSRYKIPLMYSAHIKLENINTFIKFLLHEYKNFNNATIFDNCLIRVVKTNLRGSILSDFGCYSPISTHKCEDCCFYHKNIKFLYRTLCQLRLQIRLELKKRQKDNECNEREE